MYWPPAGGGGVQRPLKFATHLPALGIETHVLAPDDPKWIHRDEELRPPTQAFVHRARYLGPRGRLLAEELHGLTGFDRTVRKAGALSGADSCPTRTSLDADCDSGRDQIVRREGIDAVVTTSPPNSVHLIGAAVKAATGAHWIADLRDSIVANADRPVERLAARVKERGQTAVVRLIANRADAIVAVSEAIAEETQAFEPKGRVAVIPNGCDFDDFAGLEYRPGDRFRITHTGSFFGKRDPRPFLQALAESDPDVVARFAGGLRAADREWAETLGLGDRLEVLPHLPHQRALELQRDSEALLLLIPDAGGRGRGVLSGKIFEYLAAERPILAAVPPDGAAADLVRETGAGIVVAPDDVRALREALAGLVARWRAGALNGTVLDDALRDRLSRRKRVEELAELLWSLS